MKDLMSSHQHRSSPFTEWPWFRDPPTVVRTDFTEVVIQHGRWSSLYDNGFSNGTLVYIGQIRLADLPEPWGRAYSPSVRDDTLGGQSRQRLTA